MYLGISTETLEWTEIEITEAIDNHLIRTQYSDDGKSWMSHRKNSDDYEEIILMSQLNDSDSSVVRIHKDLNKKWQVNLNSVITLLADGSETERIIF